MKTLSTNTKIREMQKLMNKRTKLYNQISPNGKLYEFVKKIVDIEKELVRISK